MNTQATKLTKEARMALKGMVVFAAVIGAWATTALTFALAKADWQLGELFRQYMVSIGLIQDFETMVDFYTHIKGVEYIICVAFLGAFPAFFKFLSKEKGQTAKLHT
ncbi:MAG: hypothetical protein KJ950_17625 [Proteobacteria bacterium]|nr:hypothetical protein [Pseudomonadota bacterium]MBU1689081.1 hypothetical protein [Pseudomonadota bacterium]